MSCVLACMSECVVPVITMKSVDALDSSGGELLALSQSLPWVRVLISVHSIDCLGTTTSWHATADTLVEVDGATSRVVGCSAGLQGRPPAVQQWSIGSPDRIGSCQDGNLSFACLWLFAVFWTSDKLHTAWFQLSSYPSSIFIAISRAQLL